MAESTQPKTLPHGQNERGGMFGIMQDRRMGDLPAFALLQNDSPLFGFGAKRSASDPLTLIRMRCPALNTMLVGCRSNASFAPSGISTIAVNARASCAAAGPIPAASTAAPPSVQPSVTVFSSPTVS
jgi:hypothetical protein